MQDNVSDTFEQLGFNWQTKNGEATIKTTLKIHSLTTLIGSAATANARPRKLHRLEV